LCIRKTRTLGERPATATADDFNVVVVFDTRVAVPLRLDGLLKLPIDHSLMAAVLADRDVARAAVVGASEY